MRLHSNPRLPKSNRELAAQAKAAIIALTLMTLGVAGCATPKSAEPGLTPTERIQRDQAIGAGLARQFESQVRLRQDKELLIYLHDLTTRLCGGIDELKTSAVSAQVVADRGGRWKDYALPGNRIYLSTGFLRSVQYENVLAAAIAVELANLVERHVPLRIQAALGARTGTSAAASQPTDYPSIEGLVPSATGVSSKQIDFFSPTGIFAFSDDFMLETVEPAVGILYRAGFDPRGLVSLWALYGEFPSHSPLEDAVLKKLSEKTRTVIAEYSPLRNPIVRSQAFIAIQKRIKKL